MSFEPHYVNTFIIYCLFAYIFCFTINSIITSHHLLNMIYKGLLYILGFAFGYVLFTVSHGFIYNVIKILTLTEIRIDLLAYIITMTGFYLLYKKINRSFK